MVQEITISQNTVDAEFGHGGGSAISIVTKSGTNQFHGTAYYDGRYPWANAVSDRVFSTLNEDRQQICGGTLGQSHSEEQAVQFRLLRGLEMGPGHYRRTRRPFRPLSNGREISLSRLTARAR